MFDLDFGTKAGPGERRYAFAHLKDKIPMSKHSLMNFQDDTKL
jgi:hypothetical protein